MTDNANDKTRDVWNGDAGRDWAKNQADLDLLLSDAQDRLTRCLPLKAGARVLEIGSGSGSLSLTMGKEVAPGGSVLGLDVSKQLLDLARKRAKDAGMADNVTFRDLDIQTDDLDESGFDICAAQFGMMFFSDPVLAMSRIRARMRRGGHIAFTGWGAGENPWFAIPLKAAEKRLGELAPAPPGPPAPGPMAFADVTYVTRLLTESGYTEVTGKQVTIDIRHPGGLGALMTSIRYVGPISTLFRLRQPDAQTRAAIDADIRAQFARYLTGNGGVSLPASMTMFQARVQ